MQRMKTTGRIESPRENSQNSVRRLAGEVAKSSDCQVTAHEFPMLSSRILDAGRFTDQEMRAGLPTLQPRSGGGGL
jgi:hypothetical protein